MNVETILKDKGRSVATIRPQETIGRAVAALRAHNIGALVVSEDDESVIGILSERDIVQALADRDDEELLSARVEGVMRRRVMTCVPSDSVSDLMIEMTRRRVRHFPVLCEGKLCGIVSIGDLVKSRLDEVEFEARSLRSFIVGS